jgi:hypothetical protein
MIKERKYFFLDIGVYLTSLEDKNKYKLLETRSNTTEDCTL